MYSDCETIIDGIINLFERYDSVFVMPLKNITIMPHDINIDPSVP